MGRLVRADAPDRLSPAGWSALKAHGIRTLIDLRNADERDANLAPDRDGLKVLQLPLDGFEDTAHWDSLRKEAPLRFYETHLSRFPERSARVLDAIARAEPGGVLVHCGVGRDRTGLVAMMLLALLGVSPDDIAEDHALSTERLAGFWAQAGDPDHERLVEEVFRARGSSGREFIISALAEVDVEAFLRSGGLSDDVVAALTARLLV